MEIKIIDILRKNKDGLADVVKCEANNFLFIGELINGSYEEVKEKTLDVEVLFFHLQDLKIYENASVYRNKEKYMSEQFSMPIGIMSLVKNNISLGNKAYNFLTSIVDEVVDEEIGNDSLVVVQHILNNNFLCIYDIDEVKVQLNKNNIISGIYSCEIFIKN